MGDVREVGGPGDGDEDEDGERGQVSGSES